MHTRIKFKDKEVEGQEVSGWHLLNEAEGGAGGGGEFTACGIATPEYPITEETKDKGGITCKMCLETIRYYKSIKL